ncbi:YheC/YheD family protein [Paenibacillus sp. HWE-109]|uniref:YheC/YheD family protein n=1 Tax=Paenibacillus sp. HWE-109 TaxID=1306526 RepID=UPI001EDEC252|nr:YheC/YheD family protein [Paenibacillus sp. HWE-109]UKS30783.1 YheC/YheD family protein [Paenibacillus sp. HWE-109]
MSKLSTSKWTKYKILRKSSKLSVYLPETAWLKEKSFWRMLTKYGQIIVKPTGSYGGNGVIRIKQTDDNAYEVQNGAKKKLYTERSALSASFRKKISKNFIVQQRVPLATANGRPFDLRVMVQRRRNTPWQVTGKLAKVAGSGFIVTNIRLSGGKVVTVENALKQSELSFMNAKKLLAQLDKVALLAAEQLSPSYRWVDTMGIDMAFDKKGNIWIIEVNFAPMLELFLKLKDKSMFRQIKSFQRFPAENSEGARR